MNSERKYLNYIRFSQKPIQKEEVEVHNHNVSMNSERKSLNYIRFLQKPIQQEELDVYSHNV